MTWPGLDGSRNRAHHRQLPTELTNLINWFRPDPAEDPIPLRDDAGWQSLLDRYPVVRPGRQIALKQCLDVARAAGAASCVIETRYIDRDYRSEYAEYQARSFRLVPDATHRLHFFGRELQAADLGRLPEGANGDLWGSKITSSFALQLVARGERPMTSAG